MTSDFENDEIQDTAFPVDFSDEGVSLDIYGVWVKSGPRDAADNTAGTQPIPDEAQENEVPVMPEEAFTPHSENFSDLKDLPDFADLPDIDDISSIGLEEDESPAVTADLSSINFETIELMPEIEPVPEVAESGSLPAETSFNSVDMNDFLGEMPLDSGAGTQKDAELTDTVQEEPFDAVSLSDFSFEAINPEELGTISEDELLDLPDEPRVDTPDEEIPLDQFKADTKTTVAEDDFSGFLDDLNAGSVQNTSRPEPSDSLDLDSFIDSFNETGGTAGNENEQLYDDVEPVDLELEFDESFIEDSEKIKATGASVTESEFFNSEFGVELIDETKAPAATASDEETNVPDAFEFDSLVDESPAVASALTERGEQSVYEVTDEFDDLLDSLDSAPVHSQTAAETKPPAQKQKILDLTVTEEDSLDSPTTEIPDTSDSEDYDIAFSGSVLKEEKLDLPEIRDYNTPDLGIQPGPAMDVIEEPMYSEPMTPEFDDIRALEQELNDSSPDTGDETVVANDKSTELLMIIADELTSIKNEITTLKSELSAFKAAGFSAEPAVDAKIDATGENSGFFSDDDTDETIALTGDELNNILITADFTEEKSEIAEVSETGFIADEETSEIPETLPDSIFDMPSISDVSTIEVSHVNKLGDDVSYLEGSDSIEPELSNVAIDENELETIDFSDEKLEEPVLTEFNIDLSQIEESLNDNLSVPTPDAEPVALESTESIDIPLSGNEDSEVAFDEPVLETADSIPEAPARTVIGESSIPVDKVPESPMAALPVDLKNEIKSVLSYMDQLLESLPEDKIEEFAKSEHFEVYKKLFEELGIS